MKTGLLLLILVIIHWCAAWFWVPPDALQGESYRIIYLHVPSAFSAFLCAFLLLGYSLWSFKDKGARSLHYAKASCEVGFWFTVITLATGSIWGRPTWGVWWTWDARLTTTLLLAVLFAGWNMLYQALPEGSSRTKACAILGIMIAVDVPIIYKSVTWWRTLHQPQSIMRPGGGPSTIDPEMRLVLVAGIFLMIAVSLWLIEQRRRNLCLKQELDQLSLERL